MVHLDSPVVDTARRAVTSTAEQAASLAGAAWHEARSLVDLVDDDVVAPLRARREPTPPSAPKRPPLLLWLLALVGIIVVGGIVFRSVRRRADREVERAGALRGEGVPDAYGAAVVASGPTSGPTSGVTSGPTSEGSALAS